MLPSAAPTIPEMGCVADIGKRDGDRFDNEGNRELNHQLFAGQFVCSTPHEGSNGVRQYQFGIDPDTGDLILLNALDGTRRTYYTNEYHRAYLQRQEEKEEDTMLDYYFSLTTEAAFRIHRVQRTHDYRIMSEELLWELPSTYTISSVYEDCLYTHDCPYMHLHRDGVMVLAWLDFELSPYYDGWMEKNIRGCYDFNTTDKL